MLTFDSLDPVRIEATVLPEPPPVPLAELAEPPPASAPVVKGRRVPTSVPLPPPPLTTIDARVYFTVNEAAFPERFDAEIAEVAAAVRANPRPVRIVVEGHADEIGGPRHNQVLSIRRAEAVREALREAGVPAERLRAVGYGDSRPAMPGRHAMNRRVELRVE